MSNEFDLYKRSIVYVVDYFDEEHELPWNYVRRTNDGKFEAIATHLLDGLHDASENQARERSLGTFETCADARIALGEYLERVAAADDPFLPDGRLNLSRTVQ